MQIDDDRTEAQKHTHRYAIVGTDRILSGWGKAAGGVSYAAWAFADDGHTRMIQDWVESRGDMLRVRMVSLRNWRPRGRGHTHIYVVDAGHPAFNRLGE